MEVQLIFQERLRSCIEAMTPIGTIIKNGSDNANDRVIGSRSISVYNNVDGTED